MGVESVQSLDNASLIHLRDVTPYGQNDIKRTLEVPHNPSYLNRIPLFPETGLERTVGGVKVSDRSQDVEIPSVGALSFILRQQDFGVGSSGYNADNHNTEGPFLPKALSDEIRFFSAHKQVYDATNINDWAEIREITSHREGWVGWSRVERDSVLPLTEQFQQEAISRFAYLNNLSLTGVLVEKVTYPQRDKWMDRPAIKELEGLLEQSNVSGVIVYSIDGLAPEEIVNLQRMGVIFNLDRWKGVEARLLSVTESIDLVTSPYKGNDFTVRNDPTLSETERKLRVDGLRKTFRNHVQQEMVQCVECPSKASTYDVTGGDGSSTYYRSLHVCNGCHGYSIGPEYWTTDY